MLNFIVNAKSGRGRGNKTLKKICDYCYKNNIAFSAHITNAPNHATDLARSLCQSGAQTIVAIGGDGTFSEVLNGIDNFSNVALGFIPAGRGNDYARAAKLNLNPIKALQDIIKGEIVSNDYFLVSGRRCLNVAGSGLDVAVLQRVAGRTSKLSYYKSLFYCLKNYTPYKFNISVDGGEAQEYDTVMIGVCNGIAIGGGIKLSPLSKLDDGKLNVMIMLPPKNLLSALLTFKKGKHMEKYYTKHIECEHVTVTCIDAQHPIQIDGEIFKDKILDCSIVKGGLKTFAVGKSFN